jgi:predicted nucleic acid-binding Zn ribbon protein
MPWEPLPTRDGGDEPEKVGTGLDRVVRRLGGPSVETVGGVFARWPEIVGDQIAGHTRPLAVRSGALQVAVDDPAWAPELRFLETRILERLRVVLGTDDVDRIEVRVRPSRT